MRGVHWLAIAGVVTMLCVKMCSKPASHKNIVPRVSSKGLPA
jgi:hypothetical protein